MGGFALRTLTEVFAAGAPALPEGLRTLVVSPERVVEPGMTVRATFAFYNLGGAPATGLRVRLSLPEGLRYVAGSARVDDAALEESGGESPLLASGGADIGDVAPGVERRITLAYTVAPSIENGATISLQAAIAAEEVPLIGSNVVTLTVHSRPELENPSTVALLEPLREPVPNEEITAVARVHNSGQSSAHDVVVVLPVPDHTTYVPGSARIDGREVAVDERGDPFGFAHAPVAAANLAPGATLLVEYRARIDAPLENGARLYLYGVVASAEIPEFDLARSEITVRSLSNFESDETHLVVESDAEVEPGERVSIRVAARNVGTSVAESVRVRFTLPEGLRYAPGSRTIDGRSVSEGDENGVFVFPRVLAGQRVEAALDAYVVSPAIDATQLPIVAHLQAPGGVRTFEHVVTVRARPRFLEARNGIDLLDASTVVPGSEVRVAVRVVNDGTTTANDARLRLNADADLEELRFEEEGRGASRVHNGTIDLGALEPSHAREFVIRARVAAPIADRTELRIGATLETREIPSIALGHVTLVARSRPRFTRSTSRLRLVTEEPLRPDRMTDVSVRVENEGTDNARDVRLVLTVSPEARIESVEGATRDGEAIVFGDVPAGVSYDATVRVRLARFVAHGTTVTLEARLFGVGFLPFALDSIGIATAADSEFRRGAALRSEPQDGIDAGSPVFYMLSLRNTGDGAARRLTIRVPPIANTVYVPATTSINEVALLDAKGESPLSSSEGLVLHDIDPGVEILVRWCAIVNTPLQTGMLIEASAELAWDNGREASVAAFPLRVRSTPQFAVRDAGLPFTVAGTTTRTPFERPYVALGSPGSPAQPIPALRRAEPVVPRESAPAVEGVVEAPPPAMPAAPAPEAVQASAPDSVAAFVPPQAEPEPAAVPAEKTLDVYLELDEERLARTLRFLDEADAGGLITHLFVLRSFFPDGLIGFEQSPIAELFAAQRDALRNVLDRLFIKLRLPRYTLTVKDLEDGPARRSLEELLAALRSVDLPAMTVAHGPAALAISGAVDRVRLVALSPELEAAPLGSVMPWLVRAHLLGTTVAGKPALTETLSRYRELLIDSLRSVGSLPLDEFHRVLTSNSIPALDDVLHQLLRQLGDVAMAPGAVATRR